MDCLYLRPYDAIVINVLIGFRKLGDVMPPRWGGVTHISQKIGSEEPIF